MHLAEWILDKWTRHPSESWQNWSQSKYSQVYFPVICHNALNYRTVHIFFIIKSVYPIVMLTICWINKNNAEIRKYSNMVLFSFVSMASFNCLHSINSATTSLDQLFNILNAIGAEVGIFGIFFIFSIIKNDFLHFYQVNLTFGFLNRTGAEIGY